MIAWSQSGVDSGWQHRGNWTVPCTVEVTPPSVQLPAGSGNVSLSISTPSSCGWTATSSDFMTVTPPSSGTGSAQVHYAYSANPGNQARVAYPVIAGQMVTVTQAGTPPPTETISYFHLDAIGSVRAVTDGGGNVVSRHDYLPFGQEYVPPASALRIRFTGQERDEETGQDYFGARYYLAQIERFTQPDPLSVTETRLLRPYRLNRYAYANLNPLRFVDPSGLNACENDYVSDECNGWWDPCPGWLIVPGIFGCGWNEGLLGFDAFGFLLPDIWEIGAFLTRRGTPPVTLEQIAGMLAHIPPGRPLTACEGGTLAPYNDARSLADARLHFTGLPWYLRLGMKIGIVEQQAAITRGNDVYFGRNEYDPRTADGLALLSHEVFHVRQYREEGMNWFNYITNPGRWEYPAETHQLYVLSQLDMAGFAGCPSN